MIESTSHFPIRVTVINFSMILNKGVKNNNSYAGMKLGQINFLPTDKVVNAWKELTVFLQEFIENNFGSTELQRIIRE